jgi:hypothetical protein
MMLSRRSLFPALAGIVAAPSAALARSVGEIATPGQTHMIEVELHNFRPITVEDWHQQFLQYIRPTIERNYPRALIR